MRQFWQSSHPICNGVGEAVPPPFGALIEGCLRLAQALAIGEHGPFGGHFDF